MKSTLKTGTCPVSARTKPPPPIRHLDLAHPRVTGGGVSTPPAEAWHRICTEAATAWVPRLLMRLVRNIPFRPSPKGFSQIHGPSDSWHLLRRCVEVRRPEGRRPPSKEVRRSPRRSRLVRPDMWKPGAADSRQASHLF